MEMININFCLQKARVNSCKVSKKEIIGDFNEETLQLLLVIADKENRMVFDNCKIHFDLFVELSCISNVQFIDCKVSKGGKLEEKEETMLYVRQRLVM